MAFITIEDCMQTLIYQKQNCNVISKKNIRVPSEQFSDEILHLQLEVVSRTFLDFPAVTVCNTNQVRRSAIMESKHKQVLTIDDNTATAYKGNLKVFVRI